MNIKLSPLSKEVVIKIGTGNISASPTSTKKPTSKSPKSGIVFVGFLPSESWKDESGLASFWILVCVEERKEKKEERDEDGG